MKRIILGVCLMLLLTAGLFRPQFVPVPVVASAPASTGTISPTMEDNSAVTATAETTEQTPEFVDETFDFRVDLFRNDAFSGLPVKLFKSTQTMKTTEGEEGYTKFGNQKTELFSTEVRTDGSQYVTFKDIPVPRDMRWFDQKTGIKYEELPKNHTAIVEYYIVAMDEPGYSGWPTLVPVTTSFFPKQAGQASVRNDDIIILMQITGSTNKLTGTVTDLAGCPIADALVFASEYQLKEDAEKYFQSAESNNPVFKRSRTDAEGRFQMENVPLGNINEHRVILQSHLNVYHPDYDVVSRVILKDDNSFIDPSRLQNIPPKHITLTKKQPQPERIALPSSPPPSLVQRPIQPQQEEPIPQPAIEKTPSDFPAIQLHESVLGEVRGDITMRDAGIVSGNDGLSSSSQGNFS